MICSIHDRPSGRCQYNFKGAPPTALRYFDRRHLISFLHLVEQPPTFGTIRPLGGQTRDAVVGDHLINLEPAASACDR
jgi:hypothetical protein